MVVEAMVNRRHKLQTQENPAQLIAHTAHDLMTPLTGVQLSLSLLKEDEDVRRKLDPHQHELLSTASTCSDLMIRICETSVESLRQGSGSGAHAPLLPSDDALPLSAAVKGIPATTMKDLVKSLHTLMEPLTKHVPLIISLDPAAPPVVACDDLKIFRSALNLLSSAASRTQQGCVHFRIYPKEDNTELYFECEDTAENIPVEEYQYLYQSCSTEDGNLRLCLSSVASLISSLDGLYGFRPRKPVGRHRTGSIFWFSVPLRTPESVAESRARAGRSAAGTRPSTKCPLKEPIVPSLRSVGSRAAMDDLVVPNAHQFSVAASGRTDRTGEGMANPYAGKYPLPDPLSVCSSPKRCDARIAEAFERSASADSNMPRQRRALVVDDSLVVRKSLAMALKKKGFEVSQAVNGLEGLNSLKKTTFDFV